MRLIDADALKREIDANSTDGTIANYVRGVLAATLDSAPTVDAEPVRQWISVEDRLPPENTDVLLMFPMNMAVGFLKDSEWFVNSGCNWFTKVIEDDGDEPPLFWMPLPELPKEANTDGNSKGWK